MQPRRRKPTETGNCWMTNRPTDKQIDSSKAIGSFFFLKGHNKAEIFYLTRQNYFDDAKVK